MELSRIPATMMTQHPDSASKYTPIQAEPEEAVAALAPPPKGLGIEEVMVDFEGKLTPYQQTSQIVAGLAAEGLVAGRDVFVTPRIPSGAEEGVFRQLMALMSVVESNYRAFKSGGTYAVREIVLPMTRSAAEIISVRERVNDVLALAHKEFGLSPDPNVISLIPLFETVPQVFTVGDNLEAYIAASAELGVKPKRIRYMLGFSDIALSYGFVVAALSVRLGIADGYRLEAQGLEVAPILGGGTLPFRGHLTPENVENLLADFAGARTVTVQSAMRFDRDPGETTAFCSALKKRLPEGKPPAISDRAFYYDTIGIFAKHYLITFYKLAETASILSDVVPRQRDRLARKGESGYARDLPDPGELATLVSADDLAAELRALGTRREAIPLPRAISYVAALYSIGLPPEFIGVGRALGELAERSGQDAVETLLGEFRGLKTGLSFASRFLHLETAADFLPETVLSEIEEDIALVRTHLGIEPGPGGKEDRLYRTILETMRPMLKEFAGVGVTEQLITDESVEAQLVRDWILRLGKIRGGLG